MDAQGLGRTHPLTPTRRLKQHTHAYNPRPGPRRRRVRGPCPERMDLGRREPQPEPSPARAPIVPRRRPRIHHSRPGRLTPGARPGRLTARSSPAAELRGGQDARGAAGPVLTHPATSAAGAEASAPAPAVEVAVSAPGAYSGALTGEGDDPLLEQTAGPRGPAQAPPTRRPRSGHAAARRATIIQATTAERGTATQDIPPAGTGRTSHYQSRSSRGRAPAQSLRPILPRLTPTPTATGSSCSKGHAANALYTAFAAAGLLGAAELDTFVQPDSRLNGHPVRTKVPGVEAGTGPLGRGLPIAVGDALAAKIDGSPRRVLVLTGDGELQEGSNWEALMAAAQFELDNLIVVADRNHIQQGATTEDANDLSPWTAKSGPSAPTSSTSTPTTTRRSSTPSGLRRSSPAGRPSSSPTPTRDTPSPP